MDLPEIAERDGRAVRAHLDRDALEIRDAVDVPAPSHRVLVLGDLDHAAAHLVVRAADRFRDGSYRNAVREQTVGIEIDLVLPDKPSDRGNLGHAIDPLQPVAERPILEGPELGEIVLAGRIHQRVFKYPAYASRIWPDHRIYALGQHTPDGAQIFNDPRSRPINVRPILKNYVNE